LSTTSTDSDPSASTIKRGPVDGHTAGAERLGLDRTDHPGRHVDRPGLIPAELINELTGPDLHIVMQPA
jgi:hypothetical protein